MNQNELYHHGIFGMKWGVRRYQNADGSLTSAGRKRYGTKTNFEKVQAAKQRAKKNAAVEKARAKANARTQSEIEKYNKKAGIKAKDKSASDDSKPKTKSISEMSDEELQSKIDRMRLESTYKSMMPKEKVSLGKRFVDSAINDALIPAVKTAGKQFAEKKLKDALGVSDKDTKDTSKELQKLAQDYENRTKIDKGQQYFKEGSYSESGKKSDSKKETASRKESEPKKESTSKKDQEPKKKSTSNRSTSNAENTRSYGGTAEGTGTSRRTEKNWWDTSDFVDAVFREVSSDYPNSPAAKEYTQSGISYVNWLLLEDKKNY